MTLERSVQLQRSNKELLERSDVRILDKGAASVRRFPVTIL